MLQRSCTSGVHGVDRVPDQVQNYLKQLDPIANEVRKRFVQIEREQYVMSFDVAPLKQDGILKARALHRRRRVVPHVCIVDGKRHIRRFLEEAPEELGLTACECTQVGEQSAVLDGRAPDLVIAGLPTITP